MTHRITFIGAGNMARSLIGGLLASGYEAGSICATDPNPAQRENIEKTYAIQTYADNKSAIAEADSVVLAVKPQLMNKVTTELASQVQSQQPLIISIAAGIRINSLQYWLARETGNKLAIVRCMPNTPALIQSGASGLYANEQVKASQRAQAETILTSAGIVVWVEQEEQLDAVTALSGSGPAYFFLVLEALEQTGIKMGLSATTARQLALHTALGAAKMAIESEFAPAELRRQVTSPGGTTERAINILQQGQLAELFEQALYGAKTRCRELSDELAGDRS